MTKKIKYNEEKIKMVSLKNGDVKLKFVKLYIHPFALKWGNWHFRRVSNFEFTEFYIELLTGYLYTVTVITINFVWLFFK